MQELTCVSSLPADGTAGASGNFDTGRLGRVAACCAAAASLPPAEAAPAGLAKELPIGAG